MQILVQLYSTNMFLSTRQVMQQTLHQQAEYASKILTYKTNDNWT
jgi:hypothetical protein